MGGRMSRGDREVSQEKEAAPKDRLGELDAALALMAHELRTPLTVMKGWAQTLTTAVRKMDQEMLLTSAAAISRSADQMDEILRNMSDAGALTHGSFELDLRNTLVSKLVEEIVDDLNMLDGGHAIEVKVEDDALLRIDAPRVRQILINLLTNAIKFSPSGTRVTIGVSRHQDTIEICVADQGEGIPSDKYEELFLRYSRLGSQVKGTGLGLYISRELARAHGGELSLSDADGSGCRFILTLPVHGSTTEDSLPAEERQQPR
jgi:signal transduction histidine kinase